MNAETYIIAGIFTLFALAESVRGGYFNKPGEVPSDLWIEIVSASLVTVLAQPLALFGGYALLQFLLPTSEGVVSDWPFWAVFVLFLVADDLTQYFWHRSCHRFKPLYALHRAHHQANYLSVRVVFRNNGFYYLMMPSLWLSGMVIFLGGLSVYPYYLVAKMTVIIAAHSDVRWDQPLYRIPALSPLMWLLERVISTPATHAAHHGKWASDPATHYRGNYGNFLFLWDMIFGTAKITRSYPQAMGIEGLPPVGAAEQLIWPLNRLSRRSESRERTSAGHCS